jgi:hypothetical protein
VGKKTRKRFPPRREFDAGTEGDSNFHP